MKKCCRCNHDKDESEFHKNSKIADGLQRYCKECKKTIAKFWYQSVKKEHKAVVIKRTDYLRKIAYDHLIQNPCVDCGEIDPIVLEFDHVRGIKMDSIAHMLMCGRSEQALRDEIAKCNVRCCNCHRRKTSKDFNYKKLKFSASITDNALVS